MGQKESFLKNGRKRPFIRSWKKSAMKKKKERRLKSTH